MDREETINMLVSEIASYTSRYPHAADTVLGITRWWLGSISFPVSEADVKQALDGLVALGRISEKQLPDGSVLYGLHTP